MNRDQATGQQHGTAAVLGSTAQVGRMRTAIGEAVAVGPGFLRGEVDADRMANVMVKAVRDYSAREQDAGGDDRPHGAEAEELNAVLAELMACGSGYLAGRCDAACVARTMTEMVHTFGAD